MRQFGQPGNNATAAQQNAQIQQVALAPKRWRGGGSGVFQGCPKFLPIDSTVWTIGYINQFLVIGGEGERFVCGRKMKP